MKMDDSKIQKILAELALINNKYESIAKATGNNYNIFQVLKIETKEVITHSRMIGDLLDPKGSHGMGSEFLCLFLKIINHVDNSSQKLNSIDCTIEKNYGPINNEKVTGGNIDIILEGFKKPLVIENKIYAGDQDKQLLRYYNQLNGECELFYLTLFGDEPSDNSTGGIDLEIECISYSIHILEWLEKCHEIAIDRPLLRETLKQYINIVKYLTGQSMNDDQNKEIFSYIEENKITLGELYPHLNNFVNNHLKNRIHQVFKLVCEKISVDQSLSDTLTDKTIFSNEGEIKCIFKFENSKGKGVVFELRTFSKKLSLWTTAWNLNMPYDNDKSLKKRMKDIGRYESALNSMSDIKDLVIEVIKGINVAKEYYEEIIKKENLNV